MSHQRDIADALKDAGLDVLEYRGWETRGSATFRPRGVVVHHTGPWRTVEGMVQLCMNGRSDLAGPLCHVVLDPSGSCHVIAAGRANHAGSGGWRGLSGNTSVFGIEAIHSGSRDVPWPRQQVDAFVVCAAALAKLVGVGADMICAHREWTTRKPDPVNIDMGDFRRRAADWLRGGTDTTPKYRPAENREGIVPVNRPPVRMLTHPSWPVADPEKPPYLIVTDDGGVFAFGGAPFYGSLGGVRLNAPIIDAAVTATGKGYVMLGRDGGVFAFGDAPPFPNSGRVEFTG